MFRVKDVAVVTRLLRQIFLVLILQHRLTDIYLCIFISSLSVLFYLHVLPFPFSPSFIVIRVAIQRTTGSTSFDE